MENVLIFTDPAEVYGLYTHENVDTYGRPLIVCNKVFQSVQSGEVHSET